MRNSGTASVAIFVDTQADNRAEAGDLEGKAVWMRVIGAIKELLDQKLPGAGISIH